MVQIIPREPSFSERIGGNLGAGLGGALAQIPEEIRSRRERQQLSQLLGKDISNIRNPQMQQLLLQSKLSREAEADKLRGEYQADEGNYQKIKDAFGEKFADIWMASPTGARTALTQAALEARARGIDLEQMLGQVEKQNVSQLRKEPQLLEEGAEPEEADVFRELSEIKEMQDKGLLEEEKISRGKERYTTGLKEYQEATSKLHSMTRDKERLDILDTLNKSGKLPKSLGRINVDLKEGNLRVPFLATEEAQRYVKTLNEFSAGAKDTFGARITNFDLAQYMKRYPTLLNTQEGRKQLLEQMKIVNQINSVYYKNLKKVYDEAGGVRNIDSDIAERLAEKLSEPQINKLSSKFKEIGQFSSKPNASEFKGKRIRDKETGEIFVSDGNEWVPE